MKMDKICHLSKDFESSLRWDAHVCPPLKVNSDLSFLKRYKTSGVNFVSLNAGFDLMTQKDILELLKYFHEWINKHNTEYAVVQNVQEIMDNCANNILSIAFDIEGCDLLGERLEVIADLYALGVRQMVFAYNNNNAAGGGCFDADIGLTDYGKKLVKEFNDVGMVVDCSHVGYKTSLDIIDCSSAAVVFSHSNPKKLVNHPRNITDEQMVACANRGGVVGINGIGIFLGDNDITTRRMVEHVDYAVQKIGINHVGIGLDCVFDLEEINAFVKSNPATFPKKLGFNNVAVAEPEQFAEFNELLSLKGYSNHDIDLVLGKNFLRIADLVWK